MGLQFLQAGTDHFPSIGPGADQVGNDHLPAVPVRADVPENPLRLVRQPGIPEQAVGNLRELVPCHHPTTDPRPEAAHRDRPEQDGAWQPWRPTGFTSVRWAGGPDARACVWSMPSAHRPTPTKMTTTSPDHRSRSGNKRTGLAWSGPWSDRPRTPSGVPEGCAIAAAQRGWHPLAQCRLRKASGVLRNRYAQPSAHTAKHSGVPVCTFG